MHGKKLIVVAVVLAIAVPLAVMSMLAAASHPSVIESLQAERSIVMPSHSTQIVCVVSAPDNAVLSYEWEASGGEIDGTGGSVTWTARVSDGAGNWVRQSIEFDVVDCEACVVW